LLTRFRLAVFISPLRDGLGHFFEFRRLVKIKICSQVHAFFPIPRAGMMGKNNDLRLGLKFFNFLRRVSMRPTVGRLESRMTAWGCSFRIVLQASSEFSAIPTTSVPSSSESMFTNLFDTSCESSRMKTFSRFFIRSPHRNGLPTGCLFLAVLVSTPRGRVDEIRSNPLFS